MLVMGWLENLWEFYVIFVFMNIVLLVCRMMLWIMNLEEKNVFSVVIGFGDNFEQVGILCKLVGKLYELSRMYLNWLLML